MNTDKIYAEAIVNEYSKRAGLGYLYFVWGHENPATTTTVFLLPVLQLCHTLCFIIIGSRHTI